jgi:putative ABC transport system permease protein
MFARIAPEDMTGTIGYMKNLWNKYNPDYPFDYHFIGDDYNLLYQGEKKLSSILGDFALLAVFVSCLGLFGLASFMAEQRTKEVGIRKVLGASVAGIVRLLSREFIILVAVANIIAWPLAYYAVSKWLEDYVYRMDLSWLYFLVTGTAALVIALLTVSYQAVKAALANPVDSLRQE